MVIVGASKNIKCFEGDAVMHSAKALDADVKTQCKKCDKIIAASWTSCPKCGDRYFEQEGSYGN